MMHHTADRPTVAVSAPTTCHLNNAPALLCLQTVVSKELANLEPVAYQYFSRNIPYVSSVQLHPPLGYDPEKVRLMLAAANWTVGPDGVRRNGQGQPLVGGLMLGGGGMRAHGLWAKPGADSFFILQVL
jgi:hypothetical protein